MNLHPSEIIFLIGFVPYIAVRGIFDHRTKNTEKIVRRFDAIELALLIAVGIGSLLLPVLYLFTPLLNFANYQLPAAFPRFGIPLMFFALWLFWRSHSDLGLNWSGTLELRSGHELITKGIYGSMRHPMYSAILLFDLAQGLLVHNWLAGWFALFSFGSMYFRRVRREEQMMLQFFGEDYIAYARSTGRLIPRLRRRRTSERDAK